MEDVGGRAARGRRWEEVWLCSKCRRYTPMLAATKHRPMLLCPALPMPCRVMLCHAVLCCAVQVDALVFGHLLQGGFPTLWRHLASLDVDAASVIMPWFLVGFLNSLPLDSVLRGGSRVPAQLVLAGAAWCCWCVVVSWNGLI